MIEHLEWNLYMYIYMVIFGICKLKILKCTVPAKASKKNDSFLMIWVICHILLKAYSSMQQEILFMTYRSGKNFSTN